MTRKEIFIVTKDALVSLCWEITGSNYYQDVAKQVIISRKYSHTDLLSAEDAALFLHESGIKHLLIDLPSVDKKG
jgi:hypothetical protein